MRGVAAVHAVDDGLDIYAGGVTEQRHEADAWLDPGREEEKPCSRSVGDRSVVVEHGRGKQ